MGDITLVFDDFGYELLRYEAPTGATGFRGANLEGVLLHGAQLRGADFSDADLYRAN